MGVGSGSFGWVAFRRQFWVLQGCWFGFWVCGLGVRVLVSGQYCLVCSGWVFCCCLGWCCCLGGYTWVLRFAWVVNSVAVSFSLV